MEELQGSLGIVLVLLALPVGLAVDIMLGFKGATMNTPQVLPHRLHSHFATLTHFINARTLFKMCLPASKI